MVEQLDLPSVQRTRRVF